MKKFVLLLFLFCIGSIHAQTADEIIAKHLESRGGADKIKGIKTLKIVGNNVGGRGETPFVRYVKKPSSVRIETTIQGKTMIRAFDGKIGWTVNPMRSGTGKPERLPDEQAKNMEEMAQSESALLDYKERGYSVELVGKEEVEGTSAFKLKLTTRKGDVRFYFLDAENYMLLKTVVRFKTQNGEEVESETYYGNYKEVAGIFFAFSSENRGAGRRGGQTVIERIEVNAEIPDSLFAMPEEK